MNNSEHDGGVVKVPLIQLRGVGKQFVSPDGIVRVLENVNFAVDSGEFVAIVGKSGSGKSTLLNVISGIDHPTEGSVIVNSTDVHKLQEARLAKWRGENLGFVFQFFQLIPTLSIRENLLLAMEFVGRIPRKERSDRAEALLAQVGILRHADKMPAALSGGEQQRAAIARALANDPPIVLADEPTGNLDSKTTAAIQKAFAGLVESGKTVIVVTHEDVSNSDYTRILTISDGTVVDDRLNRRSAYGAFLSSLDRTAAN